MQIFGLIQQDSEVDKNTHLYIYIICICIYTIIHIHIHYLDIHKYVFHFLIFICEYYVCIIIKTKFSARSNSFQFERKLKSSCLCEPA